MKKNILLLTLLFTISLIYGCDVFEEDDVPDPKPAEKINYTPIDEKNTHSIIGKYMVNALKINTTNSIYTSYMDGFIQLQLQTDGSLAYNYDLSYSAYNKNEDGERNRETRFHKLPQYSIKDNRTITLDTPIEFTDNKYSYTITSLQKNDNDIISFDDIENVNNIFYHSPKLCDPKATEGNESCSSVNGALKYIGYYRIEKITCDNSEYFGGEAFAGEMVATPSLRNLPDYVDLPIDIKIQIIDENLKKCFLTTDEQSDNVYLKNINYQLYLDKDFQLENIFAQVGLLGLKEELDENIRTTEINFEPKNPNFSDMQFGDENKTVSMRLKIIKQGTAGERPVRKLDDTPYISQ